MTVEVDLLGEINNAVLDLQGATFQSYEEPLKKLARLLREPALAELNQSLTADPDLEAFLTMSFESQGGMAGSAKLAWPDDHRQGLGLKFLLIEKLAQTPRYMEDFGHTYYYTGGNITSDIQSVTRRLIIPFARDYKTYVMAQGRTKPRLMTTTDSKKIFVVHGHDTAAREMMARFIEKIGFQAIILNEQPNKGRTVIEKVEANSDVGFAVVLLTPDDVGGKNGAALEPRARQNVLIELGYFIGLLGRDKVCAFKRGVVEVPSDFGGAIWETMDDAGAWKQQLVRELIAARYQIDLNKVMTA